MAHSTVQQPLAIYEQPLNERIRTLLRLEFLFGQIDAAAGGDSEWDSRLAVAGLLDTMAMLAARTDLRAEIVKELDRVAANLARLKDAPGVDESKLDNLLQRCREVSTAMQTARGLPGSELKDEELLNAVAQRMSIPGGTCGFDLPAYQHWLSQDPDYRRQTLQRWLMPLQTVRGATGLILGLLRDSTHFRRREASAGVFQQNLERNANVQLVRVAVPADAEYFAEISGSKHFFTVRFMTLPDPAQRPVPLSDDLEFRLGLCGL